VGAILVIAMLILPGATATLCSARLPIVMVLTVIHAAISAVLGVHLGFWLNCSIAAAMAVMGTVLFLLAWLFSPYQGFIGKMLRTRAEMTEPPDQSIKPATSNAL
jgi:ABC-type Mn2+/Zn2+ transport system permease subunit